MHLVILLIYATNSFAQQEVDAIAQMNDKGEQQVFLSAILETDKRVRHIEDSVMLADGWRSQSHLDAISQMYSVDSINSLKIDRYLDVHGYPDEEDFEDRLRMTPWIILVHSRNEDIRRKHLSTFYGAYKDGNLETRRLILFLEDEYQKVFGKDFQSYNQGEPRIEELLKELEKAGISRKKIRMP